MLLHALLCFPFFRFVTGKHSTSREFSELYSISASSTDTFPACGSSPML
jgi:hypothetical protein